MVGDNVEWWVLGRRLLLQEEEGVHGGEDKREIYVLFVAIAL